MVLVDNNILEKTLTKLKTKLDTKVNKVEGKQLSTNDYTTAEKTTAAAIAADPFEYIAANLNTYNTSGFHNSIFRGKKLGTEVTAAQWAEIKNGTFKDMYIGDYWTIGGTDYVICHFNYYKNCGDANCNKNHILVMPRGLYNLTGYYNFDERPISAAMTIGTTNYGAESANYYRWNAKYTEPAEEGGEGTWTNYTGLYINSHIYLDVLPAATAKMEDAFGADHVLICKRLLPSACNASTGAATSWVWTGAEQKLCLLNETQVYGQQVWSAHTGYEIGIDKWQLAIFRYYPEFANIRAYWWLRSVYSAANACLVGYYGHANFYGSAHAIGLRPLAILGE